jgi:hypothetical protein
LPHVESSGIPEKCRYPLPLRVASMSRKAVLVLIIVGTVVIVLWLIADLGATA